VWQAICAELARRRKCFDAVHLHSIRSSDAAGAALRAHLGPTGAQRRYEACPFVDTSKGWEELLERRGKHLRREVRRWWRRVAERGEPEFEVLEPPIPRAIVEDLANVERASWKWRYGNAMLRHERQRRFLEAVLEDATSPIRLWLLRIAGRPAAFALLLVDARCWYYYWPSHREEAPNAGALLLAEVARSACESSCSRLDLLRGAHSYKLLWADGCEDVDELVWSGGGVGRLVVWAHRARWRAARSARLRTLRARVSRVGDRRAHRQT
jgi:CelD/BcsL family acetyltransferase involved in cellulose biosynthesis